MQCCYTPGKLNNAGTGVKGKGDMGCTNYCAEGGNDRAFVDPVTNCSFPCTTKRTLEQSTIICGNSIRNVICAEAEVRFLSKFSGEKVGMLENVVVGTYGSSEHSFREDKRLTIFAKVTLLLPRRLWQMVEELPPPFIKVVKFKPFQP